MSDSRILAAMRQMAWERAKAELESIRCAQYFEELNDDERHGEFREVLAKFIKDVEYAGLHE